MFFLGRLYHMKTCAAKDVARNEAKTAITAIAEFGYRVLYDVPATSWPSKPGACVVDAGALVGDVLKAVDSNGLEVAGSSLAESFSNRLAPDPPKTALIE